MTSSSEQGASTPEGTGLASQQDSRAAHQVADEPNAPGRTEMQAKQALYLEDSEKARNGGTPHTSVPINLHQQPAAQTAAELVSRTATLGSRYNWLNWTYDSTFTSLYIPRFHRCASVVGNSGQECRACKPVPFHQVCMIQGPDSWFLGKF